MRKIFFSTIFSFSVLSTLFGQIQYKSKYPDIPIIDVHVHASNVSVVSNYVKISDMIKEKYGSNLAYFIGLGTPTEPLADLMAACNNRFLFTVSEMRPHKGLNNTPEEIVNMVRNGYAGLKFWFGDPHRVIKEGETGITKIDDPSFEKLFSTLERENVLMASLHIADPNGPFGKRQEWMFDPVYYWGQIRAFENVVAKYPNLIIVAAHNAWLVCQDAQIDYLRYMLSTYPNLNLDVSATFSYMHLVNYDNLRSFYIEYQDKILYGSDFGRFSEGESMQRTAEMFAANFAMLETDQMVWNSKGLNLPREVLEKIYYKNALKLYPGLKKLTGLK